MALVERELVGGECSYWACMPVRPCYDRSRRWTWPSTWAACRPWSSPVRSTSLPCWPADDFTSDHDDKHQVQWAVGEGIQEVRGHGRAAGERQVAVTGPTSTRHLTANHAVVLATGTRATIPPVEGLAAALPGPPPTRQTCTKSPAASFSIWGGVVA